MKTLRQIYDELRVQYMKDYKGHFKDEYEGHYHADRMGTMYAIQNTKYVWEKQYD